MGVRMVERLAVVAQKQGHQGLQGPYPPLHTPHTKAQIHQVSGCHQTNAGLPVTPAVLIVVVVLVAAVLIGGKGPVRDHGIGGAEGTYHTVNGMARGG